MRGKLEARLSLCGSRTACVCAGQRGCATFLFVAALYIVEGLFKAPPLYRLEAFQAESGAPLGASRRDRGLTEVAHSLHSVRSLGVFLKIFLPYDLLMTGHFYT
jgi:hypothetical protein